MSSTGFVATDSPKPYYDSCYHRDNSDNAKFVNRILEDFPTPSERYYDIRVVPATRRSFFGTIGDQCILFHSNRICVIALAPTHPIIAEDKEILEINYQFEGYDKIDRTSNNPQGSKLIEINAQLKEDYSLIKKKPLSDGYIAILLPNDWNRLNELRQTLPKLCNYNLTSYEKMQN